MSNPYKTTNLPSAIEQSDALSSIPLSLLPPRVARCCPSKTTLRQISFQSGQSAGPSQTSIVSLPWSSGANFMVAGSAYIYFKLGVTQASGTWGFSGSQPSAQALINRLTISCSSIIESIQNYNLLCTNVISPFSMSNAANLDTIAAGGWGENNNSSVSYNTSLTTNAQVNAQNTQYVADATGLVYYKYTLPLVSGFLNGNSEQNCIGLELLSSPLQIQLDWATITQAFYATVAPTAYTISELSLIYQTVDIGREYVDGLRQSMAGMNKFFSCPYSTIISTQTQYTASLSYNFSVNSSSVSAFMYGVILAANAQTSATTSKFFSASVGSTAINDASNISRRLLADGNSVYNLALYNSDSLLVRELVRCLTNIVNPDNIRFLFNAAGNTGINGTFRGSSYLVSFNLRAFSDASLCMCGTPVSTFNLVLTDANTIAAGDQITMFCVVDKIAVIDGSGAISIVN